MTVYNSAMVDSYSGLLVSIIVIFCPIEANYLVTLVFKTEGFILAFVLAYTGTYLVMSWYNTYQAKQWISAQKPLLNTQFSTPGEPDMIMTDGASDMFVFSSGRRNIQSLHTIFTFMPRHDLIQLVFTYGWTLYDLRYSPDNDVTLDFKLGTKGSAPVGIGPSYVWAVVEKDELKNLRTKRWDLVSQDYLVIESALTSDLHRE